MAFATCFADFLRHTLGAGSFFPGKQVLRFEPEVESKSLKKFVDFALISMTSAS